MGCIDRCAGCTSRIAEWGRLMAGDDLAQLRKAIRPQVYEPGRMIYREGDASDGIYCIQSGLVGVRRTDEVGDCALLRLGRSGEILGYGAHLLKTPHRTTVEVFTTSRICFIGASHLEGLIARSPGLRQSLLETALGDLTLMEERCAALLTTGLKTRFLELLRSFESDRAPADDEAGFDLPLQRKDIAALLGATPESISRLIAKLTDEGLVRIDGRRVEFLARPSRPDRAASTAGPRAHHHDATAALLKARGALLSMLEARDEKTRTARHEELRQASDRFDDLLGRVRWADREQASDLRAVWLQFKSTRQTEIIPAIYAGRLQSAKALATGIQAQRFAQLKLLIAGASPRPAAPPRRDAPHPIMATAVEM